MPENTPADLLALAHRAVETLYLDSGSHNHKEAHAAIDRAVEEAKSVIPAGPVLHIVNAALSKRDAEWREAAYAECFTPGHPTCAKFKDQHSVNKYGCGACRTVARMTT